VGLVKAVCFTKKGYKVIGIDTDAQRLEQIQSAQPPFYEPNLNGYLRDAIRRKLLLATEDKSLNAQADVCFIAVGTPSNSDGRADLSYVANAAHAIGRSLRNSAQNQLIVIHSTVPPGTAQSLVKPILANDSGKLKGEGFGLCSNPELFRQGNAIYDTEHPNRIIIGGDEADAARLEAFYNEFHEGKTGTILRVTHENAELIKYATSAFIATKISFINSVANIAQRVPGVDVRTVAAGIGLDPRIGNEALNAGLGWGGPCLPKDTRALVEFSNNLGYEPDLIRAALGVNEEQWRKATDLAKGALGSLRGKRVAVLGLAFKPCTDDMSHAVSIPIIRSLLVEGAHVVAYDPAATANAQTIFGHKIEYAKDPIECVDQADCCIIVTEWDEFRRIPPSTFARVMRQPVVIDGRRIYDVDAFLDAGVQLLAVGMGAREMGL